MRTRLLGLAAYSALSELLTPVMALSTLLKSGRVNARHALAASTTPRPTCSFLLWVHGASVGETVSAVPLVRRLLAWDKDAAVLVTAGTAAALSRLSMEQFGERVLLQHRPVDGPSTVQRFLQHWQPDALVLIESELWPNLVTHTHDHGIPIALVNARLSERSLARWQAAAPATLRALLECCTVTLAQTPSMAQQLALAGSEGAVYRGDLKQLSGSGPRPTLLAELRRAIGSRLHGCQLWLAASTHDGEEDVMLRAHAALRRDAHPDLLLVLVPRHPERGPSVAAAAVAAGFQVARRAAGEEVASETAVYVCDTLGELPALYSLVGLAFVGGSLAPLGGHNLLEAAHAPGGCTVLHGPHIEATAHAAELLSDAQPPTAVCVSNAAELTAELAVLLSDRDLLDARRRSAVDVARSLEHGVLDSVWSELCGPLGLPAAAGDGSHEAHKQR